MLVTVAVLVIVMGLMVSLARHVRASSASILTENLLRDLDTIVEQYLAGGAPNGDNVRRSITTRPGDAPDLEARSGARDLPAITPLIPDDPSFVVEERAIQITARLNNRDLVRFLRSLPGPAGTFLGNLPLGTYDDLSLRDSWGTPVVFMTRGQNLIGMSSRGYFFVSAGPDRKFLTRDDNLYSYEGR